MIQTNIREAVQSVKNYISEMGEDLGNNIDNLRIEETELSEDGKFWLITVSYTHELDPITQKTYVANPLFSSLNDALPKSKTFNLERDYKTFKVDASNKEVVSMKMYRI